LGKNKGEVIAATGKVLFVEK